GTLSWKLGKLNPGEGVQLQAEFTCLQAEAHACLTALVTGPDLPEEQAETCLEILAAGGTLEMRLLDNADPIDVGDETGYVAIVQNRSGRAVRNVRLQVDVPPNFRVVSVEVKADDHPFKLN